MGRDQIERIVHGLRTARNLIRKPMSCRHRIGVFGGYDHCGNKDFRSLNSLARFAPEWHSSRGFGVDKRDDPDWRELDAEVIRLTPSS